MNLHCPYLSGKYFKSCTVSKAPYVPSAFEMEEYCTSTRHSLCPFYCKREADSYPAIRGPKMAGARS